MSADIIQGSPEWFAIRLGKVAFTPQGELSPGDKARRLHATRLVGSFIGRFGTRTLPGGELEKIDLVEKVLPLFIDRHPC